MIENNSFLSGKIIPIIITVVLLIAVSVAYLATGAQAPSMSEAKVSKADPSLYQNLKIKAAYSDEGSLRLFALAKNNALAKYRTVEGEVLPEVDTIVIGYSVAEMMKYEGSFTRTGDVIHRLFGIDAAIGGIIARTSSPVDYLYFLNTEQYNALEGEDNRVFVKMNNKNLPKMFFTYKVGELINMKFTLKDGDFDGYIIHDIMGQKYYPMIIGAKEADLMRSEKLFTKPGDIIRGYFGKNVIIVGIIEDTGTALDYMSIIPLTDSEF